MKGIDIKRAEKVELFGLQFCAVGIDEAVADIVKAAKKRSSKIVITPNVDHIVMIKKDQYLFDIWQNSDFLYADGMPIVWASKLVRGKSLPERITGADLLPLICEAVADVDLDVMFIGGAPGIANTAKNKLLEKHPSLQIVEILCPDFGFEKNLQETDDIIKAINRVKPHLLFFCTGSPKSEKWLFDNRQSLNFGVALSVGAAIDFVAGSATRAPKCFRSTGLEWFWRLFHDPLRLWQRYLVKDSIFVYYLTREILLSWMQKR